MKKVISVFLVLAFLGGCSSLTLPVTATGEIDAGKRGEACASGFFGSRSGDASIEQAKKAGNITKVSSVDQRKSSFFIFGKTCTIVKGS